MTRFVLDASTAVSFFLPGEADGRSDDVLGRLRAARALVPAIWPLEVANVLVVGQRRGRLTPQQTARIAELLLALPIDVRDGGRAEALGSVLARANEHTLSVYDAAYLDLALREGLPLATNDAALRAASETCGVPTI